MPNQRGSVRRALSFPTCTHSTEGFPTVSAAQGKQGLVWCRIAPPKILKQKRRSMWSAFLRSRGRKSAGRVIAGSRDCSREQALEGVPVKQWVAPRGPNATPLGHRCSRYAAPTASTNAGIGAMPVLSRSMKLVLTTDIA